MKKVLSFILSLVVVLGLVACGKGNSENMPKENYVNLTVSNCSYYLSIADIYLEHNGSTGTAAGARRRITINGAVSGRYSDCSITFEYEYARNTIQEKIQLNAAGFAIFEYTAKSDKAKIVSCTGKIYL